jgi:uncharacterized protein (UPF0332 family)
MIAPEVEHFLRLADESHEVAKALIEIDHPRFSAAQSYYTIFYLAQAMLLTKGLTFSRHSAVIAAYGKEFAKQDCLTQNFTSTSFKHKNFGRLGTMERKAKK